MNNQPLHYARLRRASLALYEALCREHPAIINQLTKKGA